jgi:phosphoglycolate phosphatase
MAGLQGILFDKDGTLLDFDATWAPATMQVLDALADGRRDIADRMAEACGLDIAAMTFLPGSPIIAGDTADYAPVWAELIGMPFDKAFETRVNDLYRSASLSTLRGYDDVAKGIDHLIAKGYRIGLATNDAEATARAHLFALGVLDRFDYVAGYDSGHGAKPGPGMVQAFARETGLHPAAVALIGDSTHDMDAAKAAGAHPVGIARTPAAQDALAGHAEVIVTDLAGLIEWLDSRAAPQARADDRTA